MTPEEALQVIYQILRRLLKWPLVGSDAFVHISNTKLTKFESKSKKCKFLGHSSHSKAYQLWHPQTKSLVISRDVSSSDLCPRLLFQLLNAHPLSQLPLFNPHLLLLKNLFLHVFHDGYDRHFVIPIFLKLIFIKMLPPHLHHYKSSWNPTASQCMQLCLAM